MRDFLKGIASSLVIWPSPAAYNWSQEMDGAKLTADAWREVGQHLAGAMVAFEQQNAPIYRHYKKRMARKNDSRHA
jgi:hypothetical protein